MLCLVSLLLLTVCLELVAGSCHDHNTCRSARGRTGTWPSGSVFYYFRSSGPESKWGSMFTNILFICNSCNNFRGFNRFIYQLTTEKTFFFNEMLSQLQGPMWCGRRSAVCVCLRLRLHLLRGLLSRLRQVYVVSKHPASKWSLFMSFFIIFHFILQESY